MFVLNFISRLHDISLNELNKIRQKAGGVIIMLPKDVSTLKEELKEQIINLEQEMLAQSTSVPFYFAPFNTQLENIINDVTYVAIDNDIGNKTALEQIMLLISANGYHVTVDGQNNIANKNSKIAVIQGELVPNHFGLKHINNNDDTTNTPLILITATLKTFGIINVSKGIYLFCRLYYRICQAIRMIVNLVNVASMKRTFDNLKTSSGFVIVKCFP